MSEKYKSALNKIVVTDEMKEKIIAKASEKNAPIAAARAKKSRRSPWLKYGINIAAGFLICAVAVSAGRYVCSPDISNNGSAPSSSVPEADTSDQAQRGSAQSPEDSAAGINESHTEFDGAAENAGESHTVSGNASSEARQSDVNTSANTSTNTSTKTGAIASASAESGIRQSDYIESAGNVTERTSRDQSTDSVALESDYTAAAYTAPASPGENENSDSNAGLNKGLNMAAGGSTAATSGTSALVSGSASADTAVSSSASVPSGYFESASNETALEGAEAQNAGDAESAPLLSSSGADYSGLVVNPIQKADGIEQLQNQVGYVFKLPQYLPDEYTFGECSVFFGRLIEINYVGDNNSITYRTEKNGGDTEDISGDYNEYESVKTETIGDTEVTLKSTDGLYYNAVWNDNSEHTDNSGYADGSAYSLSIENGLDRDTIMKIVESVDYPADPANDDTNDMGDTVNAETEDDDTADTDADTESESGDNDTMADTESEIESEPEPADEG